MDKGLPDTDILSEILKAIDVNVTANANGYRAIHGRYTTSAVTVMEIIRGFRADRAGRRLRTFAGTVAAMEVLPFDTPCADLAGRIAGDLQRFGRPIGVADPMIAAVAIAHGLELITGNVNHFGRVQQLGYPLAVVNWRS